jgi:CRP-like cAMP-binding protein
MEHDMVLRAGEIAEEFYIIKKGQVEVIATDGKTVICAYI